MIAAEQCPVVDPHGRQCTRQRRHTQRHRYAAVTRPSAAIPTVSGALPLETQVGALCAFHIGLTIAVPTTLGEHARVPAIVTGELRQIYHNGGESHLELTGPDSTGDLYQVTADAETKVTLS